MSRSHVLTLATVLAVVTLTGSAGVASAAIVERQPFHAEYSDVVEDYCEVPGLTVLQAGVDEGWYTVRSRGPAGLLYNFGHGSYVNTYTNVATEAFVTDRGTYRGGSLRVTDNGDGTLTVVIKSTGISELYDEGGELIARDTGQTRFALLFDHSGTPTDPSDDVVLGSVGNEKNTGVNWDLCAVVVQSIG